MTKTRTHIGVSLDGFVASAEGLPAWDYAPGFGGEGSHGISDAMAGCGAVVMGRTSFDQGYEEWRKAWPYPGKKVFVLTHRPMPGGLPDDIAGSSPERLRQDLAAAGVNGDAYVLGGGTAVRSLIAANALDRLELVVLPFLLGRGIPLFAIEPVSFTQEAWSQWNGEVGEPAQRLRLVGQEPSTEGSLIVTYELE